jgi:hypothetical protein
MDHTVDGAMSAALLSLLGVTAKSEKGAAAADHKLEWLRSELIGKDVEFDTPFGRRALTYADQTASGRSLRYIEDYLRGFTYYIKPQLLSSVICDITVESNIQKKNC